MKKLYYTALYLFCSTQMFSQGYMLVASYRTKGDGCKDRILVQLSMNSLEECQAKRKTFYTEYNASSADIWTLTPKDVAIVYEFKTKMDGWPCVYTAHGISRGKTLEEAAQNRNKWVLENPKIYITSPESRLAWAGGTGGEQAKTNEDTAINYGGVMVEYKVDKSKSVIVKGKNTNKDVKAIVTFFTKGGSVIKEIEVEPGESFTNKIDESEFSVEVGYRPGKITEPATIEKIKKVIKDNITTDQKGAVKHSYTGVRG